MPKSSSTLTSSVCARDLMVTDVVTLSPNQPVRQAMELFEEYHLSGAPVIDEASRKVVGVFSTYDLMQRLEKAGEPSLKAYYLSSTAFDDEFEGIWETMHGFNADTAAEARVGEWMTPRVISIDPTASLHHVCQVLRDERIHRLFVTEEDALLGVLSTTDVVRCLAE